MKGKKLKKLAQNHRKGSLFLFESILAQSADGALKILGQLLEGGAGGDAVAVTQKSSGEREPTACFV